MRSADIDFFANDNGVISAETRSELERWDRVVRDYLDASADAYDDEKTQQRLMAELDREAEAIWARPVRTAGDVVLLAAVAAHFNLHLQGSPEGSLLANPSSAGIDARALAHAVKGILDLAGLKFDADGRLV